MNPQGMVPSHHSILLQVSQVPECLSNKEATYPQQQERVGQQVVVNIKLTFMIGVRWNSPSHWAFGNFWQQQQKHLIQLHHIHHHLHHEVHLEVHLHHHHNHYHHHNDLHHNDLHHHNDFHNEHLNDYLHQSGMNVMGSTFGFSPTMVGHQPQITN